METAMAATAKLISLDFIASSRAARRPVSAPAPVLHYSCPVTLMVVLSRSNPDGGRNGNLARPPCQAEWFRSPLGDEVVKQETP
jgi:hypothetical protein